MTKGFSASRAQRNKIRDTPCIVCGRPGTDPAHLMVGHLGLARAFSRATNRRLA